MKREEIGVARTTLETSVPLQQQISSFYSEICVCNYFGEEVYAMRPDGTVMEILPIVVGQSNGLLEISVLSKTTGHVGLPFYNDRVPNNTKYPKVDIRITKERLNAGPYYCRDTGHTFCFAKHLGAMKSQCLNDPEVVSRKIEERCEEIFAANASMPLMVYANCHDSSIEYLYFELNEKLCSVRVFHNLDQEECIFVSITRQENIRKYEFTDLDWSKMNYVEKTIFDRVWRFGTNLEKVENSIRNELVRKRTLLTQEEFDTELQIKVAEYEKRVKEKDDEISVLKKDIERVKKELQDTTYELTSANDKAKASYEQEILAMKLARAQQEQENLREKDAQTREQFYRDLETERRKQESEQQKQKAEQKIAEEKVRREELSTKSAEVSTLGTVAKVAAVLIPLAISAGVWVVTRTSSTSAFLIESIASSCMNGIVSVVSDTVNSIRNTASRFWGWLTS